MGRALVFVAAVAIFGGPVRAPAQQQGVRILPIHPPNPPLQLPHEYRHVRISYPTPEKRADNLAALLDLSSEQKSNVLALFIDQDKQGKDLWNDPSLTEVSKTRKIDELRDATVQRVRGLLTDEQRKKYDAIAPPKATPARPHLEPDFSIQY